MKILVSIITPTFNRGSLLLDCYESLKKQSNQSFEWIIVDDGSRDNTEEIVNTMKNDRLIEIAYIKKNNGGKHSALNEGIKIANGELTLILDSDDVLTDDCIEEVITTWKKYRDNKDLCGMSFLKVYKNGEVIGKKFPQSNLISSYIECRINNNIYDDKCEVFLTNILKNHTFPIFDGENFLQEHIVWARIGKKYKTVHINKSIYIAEYLDEGLTKSGRRIIIKNPLGAMAAANECVTNEFNFKIKVKNSLLYNTYGIFAKRKFKNLYNESNNKRLCLLMRPISYLLYLYWNKKYND